MCIYIYIYIANTLNIIQIIHDTKAPLAQTYSVETSPPYNEARQYS